MDLDAKKKSKREKKERKKARDDMIKRVTDLYNEDRFQECLDYINSCGDEGLKILQVFSLKVLLLGHFKEHDEVLALRKRQEEFGHEKTLSYGVRLIYAYCNRKKGNLLEAYHLYQLVHDDKNVDVEAFQNSDKWINKLRFDKRYDLEPELDRLALERASRFLDDEHVHSSTVAASSSTVAASSPAVAAASPDKVLSESEQEDSSLKTKSKTVDGKNQRVEEELKDANQPEEANQLDRSKKEKTEVSKTDETKSRSEKKETEGEQKGAKVLSESEQEIKDSSLKTKSKTVEEETGTKGLSKEIQSEKTKPKKAQEKVISVEFKFVIGIHVGGGLYEGQMISPTFDYPVSLIESTVSQKLNIDTLRNLSATSDLLVTVEFLIKSPETFETFDLLVTKPVVPIDSFFQKEMEKFRSSGFGENDKAKWWNQIKNHFTQKFRNVIHGFTYLWSLGFLCGDVRRLSYVDEKGRGKILSLLDKKRMESLDIKNLIKKMLEILTLPFSDSIVDGCYNLPVELTSFLTFATPDKLKCIPFFWLVNHPFFWSKKERIDFVMGLKSSLKQGLWVESDLDAALQNQSSFSTQSPNWTSRIQSGAFKRVFDNPKFMNVKPYDPQKPVQIIRYMTVCYNHINDKGNLQNRKVEPFSIGKQVVRFRISPKNHLQLVIPIQNHQYP